MKIGRRKQELHTGITVRGGGPDKASPSLGAAIAFALSRAMRLPRGEFVVVLEYEDVIGRAIRTEHGAAWQS